MRILTFLIIPSIILVLCPFAMQSQIVVTEKPGRSAKNINTPEEIANDGDFQAAFTADVRSGSPPLIVNFADQSIGEIQSWAWSFGDGETSEEQNPEHIYQEVGAYSVTLTITDGSNYYTLEKEDYISVKDAFACDTLDYPFAGTYTYYVLGPPDQGYVSGTNSLGDLAKANFFEPGYSSILNSAFLDFAVAKDISGTNPNIEIALWNNTGNNGSPGSIIGSKEVPLSEIIEDVNNDIATWVLFDEPVNVGEQFYIGIVLPINNDTLAFWTDTNLDSPAGKGWEQWDDQSWHSYSSVQSWDLRISNAIHPVVCHATGIRSSFPDGTIAVYPVPARDRIYVGISDHSCEIKLFELYDMQGNLYYSEQLAASGALHTIPLHNVPAGLYFFRAVSDSYILNKKIIITR